MYVFNHLSFEILNSISLPFGDLKFRYLQTALLFHCTLWLYSDCSGSRTSAVARYVSFSHITWCMSLCSALPMCCLLSDIKAEIAEKHLRLATCRGGWSSAQLGLPRCSLLHNLRRGHWASFPLAHHRTGRYSALCGHRGTYYQRSGTVSIPRSRTQPWRSCRSAGRHRTGSTRYICQPFCSICYTPFTRSSKHWAGSSS